MADWRSWRRWESWRSLENDFNLQRLSLRKFNFLHLSVRLEGIFHWNNFGQLFVLSQLHVFELLAKLPSYLILRNVITEWAEVTTNDYWRNNRLNFFSTQDVCKALLSTCGAKQNCDVLNFLLALTQLLWKLKTCWTVASAHWTTFWSLRKSM